MYNTHFNRTILRSANYIQLLPQSQLRQRIFPCASLQSIPSLHLLSPRSPCLLWAVSFSRLEPAYTLASGFFHSSCGIGFSFLMFRQYLLNNLFFHWLLATWAVLLFNKLPNYQWTCAPLSAKGAIINGCTFPDIGIPVVGPLSVKFYLASLAADRGLNSKSNYRIQISSSDLPQIEIIAQFSSLSGNWF